MQTKLTVRVEMQAVSNAKRFAAEHGTSLSALINAYLRRLPLDAGEGGDSDLEASPVLRRLTGILPSSTSVDDYRQHLVEKYDG